MERAEYDAARLETLFVPVQSGRPTVLGLPCLGAVPTTPHIAFLGIPYGVPYRGLGPELPSAKAPAAIREASLSFQPYYRNYDFDFDGDLFAGRDLVLVDAGDVALVPGDPVGNLERTRAAVRVLLDRGAVPLVLGGDHAVTVPVLRAYDRFGGLCVVQIDAHLDWRDEIGGIREGFSSPMRRASELPWVGAMLQVGLRGAGSGRDAEFRAAQEWGSVFVSARTVHERGVTWVLEQLPEAAGYYVTIDADGIEPSLMPGVNAPAPGGLTYWQVFDLLRGIAHRGPIVGLDLVEIAPERDPSGVTLAHAVRILLVAVGAMAHAGQFG
ncbi:agmatinase [Thermomicrobium sp. 4228-Ro]|uniref:agmatinase n=1 Tax=Thermomicrobium sp. 4228-Ro TaxID=2993937 RepID=UPI002248D9F4|nr:agmatinase [Thermomicrobium sp. 4228-Ro]MCX2728047.1 agmatinase [Thermomicrobium sp. 4228-Ro]